jgi:DDE family transposase
LVLWLQDASGHHDEGEWLGVKITAGNVDDRDPVPELARALFGKLFGDRGYISQALFEQLWEQGVQLITKLRKNMKNKLLPLFDKLLLRKRSIVETVNDQLKNISQIEHSRHRSPFNSALTHELAYFSFFPTPTSRPLPFSAFRAVIVSKAGVGGRWQWFFSVVCQAARKALPPSQLRLVAD